MKIGIIRHFKVDYTPEKFMNSLEFERYVKNYNLANILVNNLNLDTNITWDKCYCSDLSRAITTAKTVYNGDLETTKLLKEVEMYPIFNTSFKLPILFWNISARLAWKYNSKTQLENKDMTITRASNFIKTINLSSEKNILIVSHGFFLFTLINMLKKEGFKGRIPKRLKNGYLYILEN